MFKKIFTLLVASTFIFVGCQKDNGGKLVSGSFNGTITATVDDEGYDLSPIKQVYPWNDLGIDWSAGAILGQQAGDPASYSNNKFTINLPSTSPSGVAWVTLQYALESYLGLSGSLDCTNQDARVTDVDLIARTSGGYTGYFIYTTEDEKTTCVFWNVDSDTSITGTNVSISLKKGWNRIYYTDGGKATTKAPSGKMVWYYRDFPS
ncbi:MAG: hypothetical protein LBC84_00855 [Prevotellaceae bacterium]|jgi:hypothetical protein|nr:hypothetical protein [Prevotellaceae bacterium]